MSISIKKKLLTKFPMEKIPLMDRGNIPFMLGADELINDTYAFLKTFYRGCYDAYLTRAMGKSVFIGVESFALVIKGIVKAVFGRELIIIKFTFDDYHLYIDFEFDTSVVGEELREELIKLADRGGFDIIFSERSAQLKLRFVSDATQFFNSNTTRIVYNTMVRVFRRARK